MIKVYPIERLDVNADKNTLYTELVQSIIDECSNNGGGIVRFEKGVYVLSTVFLKSNVTIEISEGTELLGEESYYDYAQEELVDYPIYQDSSYGIAK